MPLDPCVNLFVVLDVPVVFVFVIKGFEFIAPAPGVVVEEG